MKNTCLDTALDLVFGHVSGGGTSRSRAGHRVPQNPHSSRVTEDPPLVRSAKYRDRGFEERTWPGESDGQTAVESWASECRAFLLAGIEIRQIRGSNAKLQSMTQGKYEKKAEFQLNEDFKK